MLRLPYFTRVSYSSYDTGLLDDEVYEALVGLSKFFRMLCSKSLLKADIEQLHTDIVVTLCKLEKIFMSAFFDIMMHLPVHLAMETLIGGPVLYRWMYPLEQYMRTLKGYVRNKYNPKHQLVRIIW